MSKTVVFGKYGVLVKSGEDSFARYVTKAYLDGDNLDKLTVEGDFPQGQVYPVDAEELSIDKNTGIIKFEAFGANYTIRELREEDGYWLSQYKTALPVEALEQIIRREGVVNYMAYLNNPVMPQEEKLYALAYPDSDYVIAIVYDNELGRYSRIDADWALVSPLETAYDDTVVVEIDSEVADALIEKFDEENLTLDDLEEYKVDSEAK
jgi:hypothetical protein